jgi:hypothetical protein
MTTTESSNPEIGRLQKGALPLGIAALVICALVGFYSPTQFFRSYLFAFIFWISFPLGCLALLMLEYMITGFWGLPLRRLFEAGTNTFTLMALLFLPLLLRLPLLYRWADPNQVKIDPVLQYKHPYLNVPFWVVRSAIYFGILILMAHLLHKWSRQQDEMADPTLLQRMRNLSGPGLPIYGLIATFACIDWVMSLEPHWFSTIYGMIFMVTQALAAMAMVTFVAILLSKKPPFSELVTPSVLQDYGNLLLTFTMLWAYLSFSQFLIIWAGNLREEIPWYLSRAQGRWTYVAVALILFHFAVPFILLLSRFVKRRAEVLGKVAAGLLVMTLVDMFWLTVPAYEKAGPEFHLTDWLAVFGIGGLWVWRFTAQLNAMPLLPLNDPRRKGITQHG